MTDKPTGLVRDKNEAWELPLSLSPCYSLAMNRSLQMDGAVAREFGLQPALASKPPLSVLA